MEKCACGSGVSFKECCSPFLEGTADAPTAEKLMRSRYTAYTVGNIDYIKKTTHKTALEDFDEGAAKSWSKNSEWLGLSIVSTEKGTEDDQDGMVEFVARYKQSGAGKEENHHERGTFKRESGKWLYVDGNIVGKEPFVREAPKIGRNEPCSCGSGKKFKKCCG